MLKIYAYSKASKEWMEMSLHKAKGLVTEYELKVFDEPLKLHPFPP